MELPISLEPDARLHSKSASVQDNDPVITSSTPDLVEPQQPEKRPTRQWAAWTRQEEESFFTALRQVGKNFEKITRRVQSKNKDQVRHYYYRLVRRMNKLLGPGLCLDAKNSKDTNAAMLRWWSLLEKYSCKASKLHLKPRRFKIFIEALENQLLKDRKKNVKKRSSQAENSSPTPPSATTNKSSGHDTRTVKLVLVESQNIPKIGAGKGSIKRNINMGVIRGNNKGDSTAARPARQRRKQGLISSAAYKKWEKAAIAGVSLVADAAEHVERTTSDKEVEHDQAQEGLDAVGKLVQPLPASSIHLIESNAHNHMKLKLQLFPIDDGTRRALEMDKHNPHLELTLSTRKRISSVLEHLNRKWGNSSVASGELMLFPYVVQRENLAGSQRWTQDSIVSAADVYTLTGSPPVFRLRYGWFSNIEFASATLQPPSAFNCIPDGVTVNVDRGMEKIVDSVSTYGSTGDQSETLVQSNKEHHKNDASIPPARDSSNEMSGLLGMESKNLIKPADTAANLSWHRKETDYNNTKQLEDVNDPRLSNVTALSAGEWADSLTTISVGDLLSDVPHEANPNCIEPPIPQSSQCLEQVPFSCDSFDAAIAAHLSRHQTKMGFSSLNSIWDAEETCDAFSFQKNRALRQEVPNSSNAASPSTGNQIIKRSSVASGAFLEDLPEIEQPVEYPADGDPMDECPSDPQLGAKDFNGLTDIYWPDSLGPLDLDIASSRYHSEDLILSDSLGGLNHLIASSLDAFQSCSFMGLNKKDSTSMVEAQESASFSDFKIGSGG